MKANELRIGNIINYKVFDELDERKEWNEVNNVDVADIEHIDNTNLNGNDDAYSPIPLTEEWLIKLGFKTWGKYTHLFKVGRNHICTIHQSKAKTRFYFMGQGGYSLTMDYVHQLQNLYFALTGEELTIK